MEQLGEVRMSRYNECMWKLFFPPYYRLHSCLVSLVMDSLISFLDLCKWHFVNIDLRSWKSLNDNVALKFLIFGVSFMFWDVCANSGISGIVQCMCVSSERQSVI
jgi:hypothetical protein